MHRYLIAATTITILTTLMTLLPATTPAITAQHTQTPRPPITIGATPPQIPEEDRIAIQQYMERNHHRQAELPRRDTILRQPPDRLSERFPTAHVNAPPEKFPTRRLIPDPAARYTMPEYGKEAFRGVPTYP